MNKTVVCFGVHTDGNVVKQIGKSYILQPAVIPAKREIKWYEDKITKK